jgi:ElaB/YqjD/DUF883 family membrane-anchored ribosome-binding protein
VTVEDRFIPRWYKFYEEWIMDNQKTNDGNARDLGRDGSGSSMGKDMSGGSAGGSGTDMNKGVTSTTATSTATGSDMSKNANDMHKTIDKVADAAQPVVDRLASTAHAGVDKVTGALAGASQQMDERRRQLADAYGNFAETGREYIRSSPATSVLIAVAAGWALSRLLSRRD